MADSRQPVQSVKPAQRARAASPGRLARLAKAAGLTLLGALMLISAAWGVLALSYFDRVNPTVRSGLAAAFGIASLGALIGLAMRRWRRRAVAAYAVLFAALLVAWSTLVPSNDRDWQPEVAVLPYATLDGDLLTMHNVRNFDYRSETDFTPAYYDKVYDLKKLDAVDLVASYWMGPAIAHLFLSFGFGKDHLAISVEARKARDEGYSSIKGFFRQYELVYIVADERDVIRVRTNYRKDPPEDVYVYRITGNTGDATRVLLSYVQKINSLKEHPEFYNTLTSNCAGTIWMNARVNPGNVPYSWKILLSGYAPQYLYEQGRLDTRLPFEELQRQSHINARAQAADKAEDFSERIRAVPAGASIGP